MGYTGSKLKDFSDIFFEALSKSTVRIQEVYTFLGHTICGQVEYNLGHTLRYVVSDGEICIPKVRSVTALSGMLKRLSQASVSVEAKGEAIADGATP